MLVAVIQMNTQDNKEINVSKALNFIDEAATLGTKFVVIPEMFNFLGSDKGKFLNAEIIPGETSEKLSKKAKEKNIYLCGGSIMEKSELPDKLYNTSLLFNPRGEIIGKYRKIHLYDIDIEGLPAYRESAAIKPGDKTVVIDTEFAKVGLSICYDLRFPELYRRLAVNGAEVITIPAAFTLHTGKDHWEPLIRARAIENQVYILASAQTGSYMGNYYCYGKSMIVDPWGIVLAKASDKECVLVADIDFEFQKKIRRELPSLNHRNETIFNF